MKFMKKAEDENFQRVDEVGDISDVMKEGGSDGSQDGERSADGPRV